MGTNTKAKADKALPKLAGPLGTDGTRVSTTRTTATAMEASPLWAGAPQLQAVTTGWTKAADALEANGKVVADYRKKLAAAIADQHGLRRDWKAATDQVIATAASTCQGSVEKRCAVALAEVRGPRDALSIVEGLELGGYYLFHAIRADLLRRLGREDDAVQAYEAAIERCENAAERAFLQQSRDALRRA